MCQCVNAISKPGVCFVTLVIQDITTHQYEKSFRRVYSQCCFLIKIYIVKHSSIDISLCLNTTYHNTYIENRNALWLCYVVEGQKQRCYLAYVIKKSC